MTNLDNGTKCRSALMLENEKHAIVPIACFAFSAGFQQANNSETPVIKPVIELDNSVQD